MQGGRDAGSNQFQCVGKHDVLLQLHCFGAYAHMCGFTESEKGFEIKIKWGPGFQYLLATYEVLITVQAWAGLASIWRQLGTTMHYGQLSDKGPDLHCSACTRMLVLACAACRLLCWGWTSGGMQS